MCEATILLLQRMTLIRGRGGSARAHHPLPSGAGTRHVVSQTALIADSKFIDHGIIQFDSQPSSIRNRHSPVNQRRQVPDQLSHQR